MALDKNDIMQLIAILQKGLDEDSPESTEINNNISKPKPKPKTKKTQQKNSPLEKSKQQILNNIFDSMAESRMHKDDIEIDKRLRKVAPTQRSRSYRPLKVKCRVCGKEEMTNPSLVESIERYKCNRCSTSAG